MTSRTLFRIFIIIFILYGIIICTFSHPGFPDTLSSDFDMPYLSDKPIGEDGFYMLTAAWNLAERGNLVYNYGMAITGVQPLGTVIYAFLAKIVQLLEGDKWVFLRIITAFNVLNLLVFAQFIGIITKLLLSHKKKFMQKGYFLSFCLVMFNFTLFVTFTYALETGIYLTLVAACILYTIRFSNVKKAKLWHAVMFGVLAGLTGLARIDFGIVFLVFLCISICLKQIKLSWGLLAGFTALIIVSPWFVWIYTVSSQIMPSSGLAESGTIDFNIMSERITHALRVLIPLATPWHSFLSRSVYGVASLLLFCLWLIQRRKHSESFVNRNLLKSNYFFNWLIALMSLVLVYPLFFFSTWFYLRYFSPLLIVILPILTIHCIDRITRGSIIFKKVAVFILPVCFFFWACNYFYSGKTYNLCAVMTGFANKNFPPPLKIGAIQSGTMGFFNENVINLDGKMNHAVLKFKQNQDLLNYLDREKIDVVIDWIPIIYGCFVYNQEERFNAHWEYLKTTIPDGRSTCIIKKVH